MEEGDKTGLGRNLVQRRLPTAAQAASTSQNSVKKVGAAGDEAAGEQHLWPGTVRLTARPSACPLHAAEISVSWTEH